MRVPQIRGYDADLGSGAAAHRSNRELRDWPALTGEAGEENAKLFVATAQLVAACDGPD